MTERLNRRHRYPWFRGAHVLPLWGLLGLVPDSADAGMHTVAGVGFDSDWSIVSADIVSGGYDTDQGLALHSGTSPSWTIPDSLGTRFQIPTFQPGYSATELKTGLPGSAVTLGHDYRFPETSKNPRDIMQLAWGGGTGIQNGSGQDLAIFEAATSEAFAVRLYTAAGGVWTNWRYTPYQSVYDTPNDATVTLIDFDAFGIGADVVVTALQITNLLITDRVNVQISGDFGMGTVYFDGSADYRPGRYSTSQGQWVAFESTKFDPDIQYVTGLRAPVAAVSGTIAAASFELPMSPAFAPATSFAVPVPPTVALLLPALIASRLRGRRPTRAVAWTS